MTATPNREDKHVLGPIFFEVADQIWIQELIDSGHLVPPRCLRVIIKDKDGVTIHDKLNGLVFGDEAAANKIMNVQTVNEEVVRHWREKAGDHRQTVVFCSTIAHAESVKKSFLEAGISTGMICNKMTDAERAETMAAYEHGPSPQKVIVNVDILTEGWDHAPTSCVILLRPNSGKSTMIQMIGRGLRPHKDKTECLVLDFGITTSRHGSLEDSPRLYAQPKDCPECGGEVPFGESECPLCGYVFEKPMEEEKEEKEAKGVIRVENVDMEEIYLLRDSNFQWCNLFEGDSLYDDRVFIATDFKAWAGYFEKGEVWYAFGGIKNENHKQNKKPPYEPPNLLATGVRVACFAAADEWMKKNPTKTHKQTSWHKESASDVQRNCLKHYAKSLRKYLPSELNKYQACAWFDFTANRKFIKATIKDME